MSPSRLPLILMHSYLTFAFEQVLLMGHFCKSLNGIDLQWTTRRY